MARNAPSSSKPARLCVSDTILAEYHEVLARPELNIRRGLRQQLLQLIQSHSQATKPPRRLRITRDPDDNIFLECADAGRADYLIIGNPQHFPKFWRKTKVITSREFIDIVAPHLILEAAVPEGSASYPKISVREAA